MENVTWPPVWSGVYVQQTGMYKCHPTFLFLLPFDNEKCGIYWKCCFLTGALNGSLIVPLMLISWGFIINTDLRSPLHCHLQRSSGPIQSLFQHALWTLLLREAQHLPESSAKIQSRNFKDSSVRDMTPCIVQPEYYAAWIYKHFYSSSHKSHFKCRDFFEYTCVFLPISSITYWNLTLAHCCHYLEMRVKKI